jgi:hypothetical protein
VKRRERGLGRAPCSTGDRVIKLLSAIRLWPSLVWNEGLEWYRTAYRTDISRIPSNVDWDAVPLRCDGLWSAESMRREGSGDVARSRPSRGIDSEET